MQCGVGLHGGIAQCGRVCTSCTQVNVMPWVQEIVFIGAGMKEKAICKQLDGALLTDEELQKYNEKWKV